MANINDRKQIRKLYCGIESVISLLINASMQVLRNLDLVKQRVTEFRGNGICYKHGSIIFFLNTVVHNTISGIFKVYIRSLKEKREDKVVLLSCIFT